MTDRLDLADAIAARRRREVVAGLRTLARTREAAAVTTPGARSTPTDVDVERCDLCDGVMPTAHRHLLNLFERQILCACEGCFALHAGDADLRPVGNRTLWLEGFDLPEDVWASFSIPIGLAFFMYSSVTDCVVALYPSPAGATESELHFDGWQRLCERNPVLQELEPDCEALIVNRLADPPAFAIAPIDRCYMLVGLVKRSWEGISGGPGLADAISGYFEDLRGAAVAA
jgi:hypothetical protein